MLVSEGCCKESYRHKCIEKVKRKKVYPRNIRNLGRDISCVAIPHTDPCYVETTGIAIGVLQEPVSFFRWEPIKRKCGKSSQSSLS